MQSTRFPPPKVRTGQVRHSHDLVSLLIQQRCRARGDIAVTPPGWQSSWNCLLKRELRPDEITLKKTAPVRSPVCFMGFSMPKAILMDGKGIDELDLHIYTLNHPVVG